MPSFGPFAAAMLAARTPNGKGPVWYSLLRDKTDTNQFTSLIGAWANIAVEDATLALLPALEIAIGNGTAQASSGLADYVSGNGSTLYTGAASHYFKSPKLGTASLGKAFGVWDYFNRDAGQAVDTDAVSFVFLRKSSTLPGNANQGSIFGIDNVGLATPVISCGILTSTYTGDTWGNGAATVWLSLYDDNVLIGGGSGFDQYFDPTYGGSQANAAHGVIADGAWHLYCVVLSGLTNAQRVALAAGTLPVDGLIGGSWSGPTDIPNIAVYCDNLGPMPQKNFQIDGGIASGLDMKAMSQANLMSMFFGCVNGGTNADAYKNLTGVSATWGDCAVFVGDLTKNGEFAKLFNAMRLSLNPPSITNAAASGTTQTSSGLVCAISTSDSAAVDDNFQVTTISAGSLFKNNGTTPIAVNGYITAAEGAAGLKWTAGTNADASVTIGIKASNGTSGSYLSDEATGTITVTSVVHDPTATGASTTVNVQTTSGLVISKNAGDPDVDKIKITSITHGKLYKHNGTTEITAGSYITTAEGAAGLKFTPTTDYIGTGTFIAQASVGSAARVSAGITVSITVGAAAASTSLRDRSGRDGRGDVR